MKARFSHLFKIIGICIISFLACVILIEGIRIIEAQTAIDNIARNGARYAATDQFTKSFCGTSAVLDRAVAILKVENTFMTAEELLELDRNSNGIDCFIPDGLRGGDQTGRKTYHYVMADAARYYSTLEIMQQFTPNIIDARFLKMTFCSNRPGFIYDANADLCSPQDDLGRSSSGDKISIRLTYDYPLGSSLGLTLVKIPLHTLREAIVEIFR